MCTVTFVPAGNHFFFTSSRDEQAGRQLAEIPDLHLVNGRPLLFPRDPQGGGSWIVVDESGNAAVLLNGAFLAHKAAPPYKKSRGLILLDLMSDDRPAEAFDDLDLHHIEPFTIILFDRKKLFACSWDGLKKYINRLNESEPQIWSSVTLYGSDAISRRKTWFKNWKKDNPDPSSDQVIRFHMQGGDGNPANDILMNRGNTVFTNSISSIHLWEDHADFLYKDLRNGTTDLSHISYKKPHLHNA